MRYLSTRGAAPELGFEEALLTGLAPDGGLYVPATWPRLTAKTIRGFRTQPYAKVADAVMRPFVGDAIPAAVLAEILRDAAAGFTHPAVTPLIQIGSGHWLLELFHGPTLAFKDIAMQALARFYTYALERHGSYLTLIGATSGDTGSAAIEALRNCHRASIFILHPKDKVSEVQRRQMTCVLSPNVHNIAIEGSFDDCQTMLKAMFNDVAFRDEIRISGVNSINWARILPQVVYYFVAAAALGAPDTTVSFTVPSGNFGNVFAGYIAHRMGLPIDRLVVASNSNDILTRAIKTGDHTLATAQPTLAPSMDIQIASNFERLLFEVHDRDGQQIQALMTELAQSGSFTIPAEPLAQINRLFDAYSCNKEQLLTVIGDVYRGTGIVIDPHTAVGVHAGRQAQRQSIPMITLATAHPAKFPEAVASGCPALPALPPQLNNLYQREERYQVIANDRQQVMEHIRATIKATGTSKNPNGMGRKGEGIEPPRP